MTRRSGRWCTSFTVARKGWHWMSHNPFDSVAKHREGRGSVRFLAPDVVQLDDGGPTRRAARRPIIGPERVARLMVNLAKRIHEHASMEVVSVNGVLGILFRIADKPDMVMTFDYAPDGLVRRIFIQLTPDKLRHIT